MTLTSEIPVSVEIDLRLNALVAASYAGRAAATAFNMRSLMQQNRTGVWEQECKAWISRFETCIKKSPEEDQLDLKMDVWERYGQIFATESLNYEEFAHSSEPTFSF